MSIQERTARNYGSVEQPHLEKPSRKCCTVKYRPRYFYSKGAFLVLFWIALVYMTAFPLLYLFSLGFYHLMSTNTNLSYLFVIALPIAIVCILLTGWLADVKFGNYKVFKAGAVLTFIAASAESLALILQYHAPIPEGIYVGFLLTGGTLGILGIVICTPTALQLGLDQMPDASAVSMSSFIVWFIASGLCGGFISWLLPYVVNLCAQEDYRRTAHTLMILGLHPVLCMTIACCSIFIMGPKYLIFELKSPQSLMIIYQVLKFAAKHKVPLNRSALTYCEENRPSRLDLGKNRYGGPFTTEQVEDIKTFFKLLLFLVPVTIICWGSAMTIRIGFHKVESSVTFVQSVFLPSSCWISLFINEFAIYPFAGNKLPTILKRIGIITIIVIIIKCLDVANTASNFIELSLENNTNCSSDASQQFTLWANALFDFLNCSMILFLLIGTLEFVCAQSPYNMRGLLSSCCIFVVLYSPFIWNFFSRVLLKHLLSESLCLARLILKTVAVLLCLIGFILYCVLASWYKLRVRDEEYNARRVVEEVYNQDHSHRSYH